MRSNNRLYLLTIMILFLVVGYLAVTKNGEVNASSFSSQTANGIIVLPLSSDDSDNSVFAIVDVKLEKIMVYELASRRSPASRLKLAAVRSFSYDKLLEQYNNAEPLPETIKNKLINVNSVSQKDLTDLISKPATD